MTNHSQKSPTLIVHGGAGDWAENDFAAALHGVRAAATRGKELMDKGARALEIVEEVVVILEDDPIFDSGYGSFLNTGGQIEMDALIADGRRLDFGAVAAVQHVKNPIKLARHVLEHTPHSFFVGSGADQLALELGLKVLPNLAFVTERQFKLFWKRLQGERPFALPTGTVGAVALDAAGDVASATSTGGVPDKQPGRVGDSPLFGAGGYADNRWGAVSATGHGETIMRFLLSRQVISHIAEGLDAQAAALQSLEVILERVKSPAVGLIAVDVQGQLGAAYTTGAMPVAWIDRRGVVQATMHPTGALFKS